MLAEWTGLEPATPGVTGRYSNQLNYHSINSKPQYMNFFVKLCYCTPESYDAPQQPEDYKSKLIWCLAVSKNV